MRQTPRFVNTLSLSLTTALLTCAGAAQTRPQPPVETAAIIQPEGLPGFLLPVPGGKVEIGMTAEDLIDAACQTSMPSRPEMAVKANTKAVQKAMRKTASALGRRKVEVEPFLLGKWPVKNREYEVFVARSRQKGSGMKPVHPPFGWWRFGRQDHYNETLPTINRRFPGNKDGPVLYWAQEGHKLPYKLADERGSSIADHPVVHVSWLDANAFAAQLGMRLPLEAEWTRAARGDGSNNWPWGDPQDPEQDLYTGTADLKTVLLANARDQHLKPVGTVEAAHGPFGHVDMCTSVWQLISTRGYYPINGTEDFATEWKALQQDKTGKLLEAPPLWKNTRVIAKGGSYLSHQDPIDFLIDQRVPILPDDVLESVGFRLAKSLRPGYDALFSRLRGVYNRAPFLPDQDIDLTGQAGAERYELAENGFPEQYDVVTFAPTNWLGKEKRPDLKKLWASSHQTPLVLGTLISTKAIDGLQSEGDMFTVLYRAEGMPRELEDAIKRGYKEVQAALKAAAKAAKNKKKVDDKKTKRGWNDVLRRYGLTPKDLEPKGANDDIDFVRIDGVVVKTDRGAFLLHNNEGKVVASIPAPKFRPVANKPFATEMKLEANGDGKAIAKFRVGIPMTLNNPNRVAALHFHLPLDCQPPTPEKPWRLPE